MEEAPSVLEIVLTWGSVVLVFGSAVSLQIWSRRRRRRAEDGSGYNAEGAEAMIHPPGLG